MSQSILHIFFLLFKFFTFCFKRALALSGSFLLRNTLVDLGNSTHIAVAHTLVVFPCHAYFDITHFILLLVCNLLWLKGIKMLFSLNFNLVCHHIYGHICT